MAEWSEYDTTPEGMVEADGNLAAAIPEYNEGDLTDEEMQALIDQTADGEAPVVIIDDKIGRLIK